MAFLWAGCEYRFCGLCARATTCTYQCVLCNYNYLIIFYQPCWFKFGNYNILLWMHLLYMHFCVCITCIFDIICVVLCAFEHQFQQLILKFVIFDDIVFWHVIALYQIFNFLNFNVLLWLLLMHLHSCVCINCICNCMCVV